MDAPTIEIDLTAKSVHLVSLQCIKKKGAQIGRPDL